MPKSVRRSKPGPFDHQLSISGLNSDDFGHFINGIRTVDEMLSKEYEEGSYDCWNSLSLGGFECVEARTRILSPGKVEGGSQVFPSIEFDPNGVLRKLIESGKFRYAPDNRVHLARETRAGKLVHARPYNFRVGDLIEMDVSFIGIRVRDTGRHRMKVVLRRMKQIREQSFFVSHFKWIYF